MNDNILFWDVETTGLSVYKDRIITLSFILNGKTKTFNIKPDVPISEGSSRIHGIYEKDVLEWNSFSYYSDTIMKILEASDTYCFYNGRNFDYPILYIELLRSGHQMPDRPCIDVYETVQGLFKSLKLKDIYRTLLGKNFSAHNSLEDTKATMELFYHLKEKYFKK